MKSKLALRKKQFLQEKDKELQKFATMREEIIQRVEKEYHDEDISLDKRAESLCVLAEHIIQIIQIELRLLRL